MTPTSAIQYKLIQEFSEGVQIVKVLQRLFLNFLLLFQVMKMEPSRMINFTLWIIRLKPYWSRHTFGEKCRKMYKCPDESTGTLINGKHERQYCDRKKSQCTILKNVASSLFLASILYIFRSKRELVSQIESFSQQQITLDIVLAENRNYLI